MLIQIPDILTPDEVAHCRRVLEASPGWTGASPRASRRR